MINFSFLFCLTSRPTVLQTAWTAWPSFWSKVSPVTLGQTVMWGWPVQASRVFLSRVLASQTPSLRATLFSKEQKDSAPSAAETKWMTLSYLLSLSVVQVHPSSSMIAWNSSLETQACGSAVPRSHKMMQGDLLISASRVKQSSAYIWKRMSILWNLMRSWMLNLAMRIMPPACTTKVGTYGTENTLKPFSDRSFWIRASELLFPPHGPPVITILQIGLPESGRGLSALCFSRRQTWLRADSCLAGGSTDAWSLSLRAFWSMCLSSSFSLKVRRAQARARASSMARKRAACWPYNNVLNPLIYKDMEAQSEYHIIITIILSQSSYHFELSFLTLILISFLRGTRKLQPVFTNRMLWLFGCGGRLLGCTGRFVGCSARLFGFGDIEFQYMKLRIKNQMLFCCISVVYCHFCLFYVKSRLKTNY